MTNLDSGSLTFMTSSEHWDSSLRPLTSIRITVSQVNGIDPQNDCILDCCLQILQRLINADKEESQGDLSNFMVGPSITVMIRRNYIYEDAFEKLSPENGMDNRNLSFHLT